MDQNLVSCTAGVDRDLASDTVGPVFGFPSVPKSLSSSSGIRASMPTD